MIKVMSADEDHYTALRFAAKPRSFADGHLTSVNKHDFLVIHERLLSIFFFAINVFENISGLAM